MKKYITITLVLLSTITLTSCNSSEDNFKDKENEVGIASNIESTNNTEDKNNVNENEKNIELENIYMYGNSVGNFQNQGYANYYNGITYFSKKDGIYTLDDAGESKKLIDVYEPFGINIVPDKIIFGSTSANSAENEPAEFVSTLYTADINGENIKEILAVEYMMDIMVCNDKVYFIEDKAMTTFLSNGRLICSNIDGSNKVEVVSGLESTSYIEKYFIYDNNIYYLQGDYNPKDDRLEPYEFTLKKLELDTMKTSTLITELDRLVYFDENSIYFKKTDESEQIYKYEVENGDIFEVDFGNEISSVNAINYNDDNIFFASDAGLFKISRDTLEEEKLEYGMEYVNDILIADNWLFAYGYGVVEYYNTKNGFANKETYEELEKIITVDDATHIVNEYFGENCEVTLVENSNNESYCFVVDYSNVLDEEVPIYTYAYVDCKTLEISFEEAGYGELNPNELYSNIPNKMFPMPTLNDVPIAYDYFVPSSAYEIGTWYVYADESAVEEYKIQLADKGFNNLGEMQSVSELWVYELEDGSKFVVEIYENSICLYVNKF